MQILYVAITIFGIAALGGLLLISFVLRDREAPKPVALLHGALGATGIALLVYYTVNNSIGPVTSIFIFAIAALGGITMGYRHFTGKSVPKWLALVHGSAALVGFVFLILFTFHS